MTVNPAAAQIVSQRLSDANISEADRLIVVHVSAGNPFRRWPLESFAALIADLAARSERHRIVLTAGPSDRAAAARVVEAARRRLGDAERRSHRRVR